MAEFNDLSGKRYGKILVLNRVDRPEGRTGKGVFYRCMCDCGNEKVINRNNIAGNFKKYGDLSCGCIKAEKLRKHFTTHGMTHTERYSMWMRCKERAKEKGLPFDIEPQDIPEVPELCPYLGIPIFKAGRKQTASSPSVDRKDSSLGYVKGNLQIISNKANIMKHNATFREFEMLYLNWKRQVDHLDLIQDNGSTRASSAA